MAPLLSMWTVGNLPITGWRKPPRTPSAAGPPLGRGWARPPPAGPSEANPPPESSWGILDEVAGGASRSGGRRRPPSYVQRGELNSVGFLVRAACVPGRVVHRARPADIGRCDAVP